MRIPEDIVKRIHTEHDIIELCSKYTTLKKSSGGRWKGLSPFSKENTPSFMVTPSKGDNGLFYCWSTAKGGNGVKFIMEVENCGYREALEIVAEMYGIEIPEPGVKTSIPEYRVNAFFAKYWHANLLRDYHALSYLMEERGLSESVVREQELGLCSNGSFALQAPAFFSLAEMESAGVIRPSDHNNGHYDSFAGRIVWPIKDYTGKYIGFGGRVWQKEERQRAKYINSPETNIFKKGDHLYNLNRAKRSIRRESEALLTEGYMDVSGLETAGVGNVVANMGTALTKTQCALLARFTDKVVLFRDGDKAGLKAIVRDADMLLSMGMFPAILMCDPGIDPDDARKMPMFNPSRTGSGVSRFTTFLHFMRWLYDKPKTGEKAVTDRTRVFQKTLMMISNIPTKIERESWIKEFLSMWPEADEKEVRQQIRPKAEEVVEASPTHKKTLEYSIAAILVKYPDEEVSPGLTVRELCITFRKLARASHEEISKALPNFFSYPSFKSPDIEAIFSILTEHSETNARYALEEGTPSSLFSKMSHEEYPFTPNGFYSALKVSGMEQYRMWIEECDGIVANKDTMGFPDEVVSNALKTKEKLIKEKNILLV